MADGYIYNEDMERLFSFFWYLCWFYGLWRRYFRLVFFLRKGIRMQQQQHTELVFDIIIKKNRAS